MLKKTMRECDQTVRPSFMKMFFRMAESFARLGDRCSLHGIFEDLAVVNTILIEDLPLTGVNNLVNYFKGQLEEVNKAWEGAQEALDADENAYAVWRE